jgi:fructokinase
LAQNPRIGVDLGGSKIEVAALDEAGAFLIRRRVPTPAQDYRATIEAICGLVEGIEAALGCRCQVGVGTPGAISPATGLIKNANSLVLNGRALDRDLALSLGRPVRLANDANCLALSEAVDGAAAGALCAFGAILGTGVGGGVAVERRILTGPNAIAGEWGHNPLPAPEEAERPDPPCYCGRRGCIETYLSGPGLERDHAEAGGGALTSERIAARAAAGDRLADAALSRYEERLARALAGVINILDPDVIVLGGGLSRIERLYERVPLLWGRHIFSDRVDTPLRPARHGDASGVRGAAWLWPLEAKA